MALPEVDLSQVNIVEIILGMMIGVLLVVVALQWTRLRALKQALADQPRTELEPATPGSAARRLEQDLSFLADYIKEYTKLIAELNAQTEVRQIPPVLLNAMVRIFRAEHALVLIRRNRTLAEPERRNRLIVAAGASTERGMGVGAEVSFGEGHIGYVAERCKTMDRHDYQREVLDSPRRGEASQGPVYAVAAPMVHDAEALGVIAISRPQRYHPQQKEMMEAIASLGALAWNNLTVYGKVKIAADVDELTNIYNKRALKFRLSEYVYRARERGARISVFLFDIDHFKHYNDHNGHIAGDQALRVLAQLVQDSVRTDDVFGRFGGEEFLLIMPGRTPAQALSAASNILQRIERYDFPFGKGQPMKRVTVSGGVATFPDDAQDAVELLLAADAALYRAKQGGRNRVVRAVTGLNPPSTATSVDLDDSQA
ncbi:MAG TPA: sensor domain-containing diguanylate cyclase [Thermoanaerobaculales bacterium]|nr:sensor domain-containing diguanylate cyclase [Thermoanaerobaculales bacterium]HQL30509.1 sensor domain-containing diguanylate cyclase [Thermoanaerobaculales bacterium]HQN95196.1 sensor domain-containing diguanylate cyclase [Thermoanaerobaculales bacterium]HQP44639.1 sensor domain-containing diguanylate cyclase [Thermoanaerobaculales bacterium]